MTGAVSLIGCILAETKDQFFTFYPKPIGERVKNKSDFWERVIGIKNQNGKLRSLKSRQRDLK